MKTRAFSNAKLAKSLLRERSVSCYHTPHPVSDEETEYLSSESEEKL